MSAHGVSNPIISLLHQALLHSNFWKKFIMLSYSVRISGKCPAIKSGMRNERKSGERPHREAASTEIGVQYYWCKEFRQRISGAGLFGAKDVLLTWSYSCPDTPEQE
jgi:hypothetical protein